MSIEAQNADQQMQTIKHTASDLPPATDANEKDRIWNPLPDQNPRDWPKTEKYGWTEQKEIHFSTSLGSLRL